MTEFPHQVKIYTYTGAILNLFVHIMNITKDYILYASFYWIYACYITYHNGSVFALLVNPDVSYPNQK